MFRGLVLVATILGLFLVIYQEHKELFRGEKVVFLSALETQRFLIEDRDGYVTGMTYHDLSARGSKTHRQYLEKAGGATLDYSEKQKEVLEKAVEKAEALLREIKHPIIKYEELVWNFALVLPVYEEGLPHTRKDTIFLYPSHLEMAEERLVNLLVHEWVHLYQRKNLVKVQEGLMREGYKVWRKRKGYPRIRANPDVDEYIYIHPSGQVMLYVYNKDYPNSINDIMAPNGLEEHPFEEMAYRLLG